MKAPRRIELTFEIIRPLQLLAQPLAARAPCASEPTGARKDGSSIASISAGRRARSAASFGANAIVPITSRVSAGSASISDITCTPGLQPREELEEALERRIRLARLRHRLQQAWPQRGQQLLRSRRSGRWNAAAMPLLEDMDDRARVR